LSAPSTLRLPALNLTFVLENVVYILGAGFSAPAGIPVVRNFLERAHDLYDSKPEVYGHFEPVFTRIKEMASVKNYFDIDTENIEEMLSMLEMAEYAGHSDAKTEFQRFICDVISAYTPSIRRATEKSDDIRQWAFGGSDILRGYGRFVAGVCGLILRRHEGDSYSFSTGGAAANYTIVSLNYDRLLENTVRFFELEGNLSPDNGFVVLPSAKSEVESKGRCVLAKLHGGVESGPKGIVPPTWNKGRNDKIAAAWKHAYSALSRAHRIRILGYSLPDNDAHFRYLLRAAAEHSQNLKSVDVLCVDDAESNVHARYRRFITSRKLNFNPSSTETYLAGLVHHPANLGKSGPFTFDLEAGHAQTFARPRRRDGAVLGPNLNP